MTRSTTLAVFLCALTACGPSAADEALAEEEEEEEEEEEFRKSLVGYYSRQYTQSAQPNPERTGVGVLELFEDGTGRRYNHSCDGEIGEDQSFVWSLEEGDEPGDRSVMMNFEAGVTRVWAIPDPCTPSSSSLLERPDIGDHEGPYYPGQACNPTIGPPQVQGMRLCGFETCGGVSPLCGGGE